MNKQYRAPSLVEYGRIDQVTLGASGPKADAVFDLSSGQLNIDANAPTCDNNVGSGYCYTIVP